MIKTALLLTVALASGLTAQRLKIPPKLEALSRQAKETVDVNLDAGMIRFAEQFLSDKDAKEVRAKRILRGLTNIYVRVLEFDSPGSYSFGDLDELRAQVQGSGWSRMIEVRSHRDENVEVYGRLNGSEMTGMVVIAAEPRELVIVQIEGPIRPEDIASLSGRFGIPRFGSIGRL